MHKRTAHRWRTIIIVMAGVFFALGSFWLLQVMNQNGLNGAPKLRDNEPDYFVDNFSVVRMTPAGQPAYIVSGIKLTHRPGDDSSDIDLPFVRKLAPGVPATDVHALHARIDQNNSRVKLMDKVTVDRAASAAAQGMNLKTEALTVYPDNDRMETDQPVEMLLGTTFMSGIGMSANNATRQIDVAQRVRITIPPAPH
ncbi:MAG TPA: LPS export ABC transporter periplasmic protein LptC [Janthinobacterium sp.]|nr:LPS export ABC transporter periplasmic protein LptC [Janthinobacterium sp.]